MKKTVLSLTLLLSSLNMAAHGSNLKEVGKYLDDTGITSKIKIKLTADTLLNPFDIRVTTVNGVVSLEGEVATKTEFTQAVFLCESTDGVSNIVTKDLHISESHQPIKDAVLTGRVKGRILKERIFGDKDVNFWSVHVESKDGIVYLSGETDNKFQRNNIIETVKKIAGNSAVNYSALK